MSSRRIRRIVVHCSAGPASQRAADIIAYHTRPVSRGGRGWKAAGYHYIVEADGTVVEAVGEEGVANGARGFNQDSIHICYTGGVDARGKAADTRTPAQLKAMEAYVKDFHRRFPEVRIIGHNEVAAKACPSFDVQKWLKSIGINQ